MSSLLDKGLNSFAFCTALVVSYKSVRVTDAFNTLQHGAAFALIQGTQEYAEHGVGIGSNVLYRYGISRPYAADFIFNMVNSFICAQLHIPFALFQSADKRGLKGGKIGGRNDCRS